MQNSTTMAHEFFNLKLSDGLSLKLQIKEAGAPIWLIGTHGISEHMMRHQYLHQVFQGQYNILLYDLRGHGESEGERAHIKNFYQYMDDLQEIIQFLQDKYRMQRHVLFGHSMGALITAGYVQRLKSDSFWPEKVFVNAPPAGLPGPGGILLNFLPLKHLQQLARIRWWTRVGGVVNLKKLSHDPQVYLDYVRDPKVSLKISTQLGLQLCRASREVFSRSLNCKVPLYGAQGTQDVIVNPQATINFFQKIETKATFKIIKGGYHELHNEIKTYREPYLQFLKDSLGTL
jgi:acylglycerol lipase